MTRLGSGDGQADKGSGSDRVRLRPDMSDQQRNGQADMVQQIQWWENFEKYFEVFQNFRKIKKSRKFLISVFMTFPNILKFVKIF